MNRERADEDDPGPNRPEQPNRDLEVTDKYSGEVATRVALADAKTIDRAIQKAVEATGPMARLPAYARAKVLHHCVKRFEERAEELALLLCVEAGKPIKDSRGEVMRLIDTFRIAAEEATRMTGEVLPLDINSARQRICGDVEAGAHRALLVHIPLQLSAQSSRP